MSAMTIVTLVSAVLFFVVLGLAAWRARGPDAR